MVVVDALDECSDQIRWGLVETLRKLEPNVRLMITSRPLESISQELVDFERLEIKANRADIELFVDQQIRSNVNLRRIIQRSPGLRHDIKAAVRRNAEDMYCTILCSLL